MLEARRKAAFQPSEAKLPGQMNVPHGGVCAFAVDPLSRPIEASKTTIRNVSSTSMLA